MAKGKPKGPKPKKKPPAGLSAFAGPGADAEAVAQAEEASAGSHKRAKKRIGEPDDKLVIRHIDKITAAQTRHAEAHTEAKRLNAILRNDFKAAKADGVDVEALKRAFIEAKRPTGAVIAEMRNVGRYLRLMDSPIGTQWNLFPESTEQVKPLDAAAAGEQAYLNNEPIDNCPHLPGSVDFVAWTGGWNNEMRKVADKMKPKSPPPAEEAAPLH